MENQKILTLKKTKIIEMLEFIILLAVATFAPLFHYQPVTGVIVNAILFISVALLGYRKAILIGLIPSLIAFLVGFFPKALLPIIPIIMMGNITLILVFEYMRKKGYLLSVISSSILKFGFLYLGGLLMANLYFEGEMAKKVLLILGWMQLITAVIGGIVAVVLIRLKKSSF